MEKDHLKLINDLLDIRDVGEKIVSNIDMENFEKMHKRRIEILEAKQSKRWSRKKNHYDSLMFKELRN